MVEKLLEVVMGIFVDFILGMLIVKFDDKGVLFVMILDGDVLFEMKVVVFK